MDPITIRVTTLQEMARAKGLLSKVNSNKSFGSKGNVVVVDMAGTSSFLHDPAHRHHGSRKQLKSECAHTWSVACFLISCLHMCAEVNFAATKDKKVSLCISP